MSNRPLRRLDSEAEHKVVLVGVAEETQRELRSTRRAVNSEMDAKVDDENQRSVNEGDWICPDSQYV